MNRSLMLSSFLLGFGWLPLACRNQIVDTIPQIINIRTEVNAEDNYVAVSYDLIDDSKDDIDVSVQISSDGGKTFRYTTESVYGDVGEDEVSPGRDRTFLWHYDYDTVDFDRTGSRFVVKIIADDRSRVDIQDVVDRVEANRLQDDIGVIEGIRHRKTGRDHLRNIREFIGNRFKTLGLNVNIRNFDYEGYDAANIVAYRLGVEARGGIFALGAHFDTVENTPGAEDNGSGVVIMLEVARILSAYTFENSLAFIGFDLEEEGGIGSREFVRNQIPEGMDISGFINLDQVGYFSFEPESQILPEGIDQMFPVLYDSISTNDFTGDFVWNIGNENSNELVSGFESSVLNFVPGLKVFNVIAMGNAEGVRDLRRSDHANFWDAGYRAIQLSAGSGGFRNPYYHGPGDTRHIVNYPKMADITRAVAATIAGFAGIRHSGYAVSEEFEISVPAESNDSN
jgi:hypothetical protein